MTTWEFLFWFPKEDKIVWIKTRNAGMFDQFKTVALNSSGYDLARMDVVGSLKGRISPQCWRL